jgi:hypothetical protein
MSAPFGTTATINPSAKSNNIYLITAWCIVAVVIALRLFHFIDNRSLWEDEIYLSAGIVHMNFHELLAQPLPYLQKAPIGYLLITRLLVQVFGNNEMALRLYPLVTSTSALILFIPVARYYLKPLGAVVALALLALAPPLVYHSVEAKPYGTELFATVLVLWLYIRYQHATRLAPLFMWGVYGAILMWFVYTGIFVQAAVALVVIVKYLKQKDWKIVFRLMVPFGMWVVSFGASYLLYAKQGSDSGWLVDFWEKHDGYIPLSPVAGITWIIHRVFSFFHYPLGLSWKNDWSEHGVFKQILQRMAFIPIIFTLGGVIWFFKYNKKYLLLTGAVVLVAIVASALKMYPFHERLTVYLAPVIILIIAGGTGLLSNRWIYFTYVMAGLLLYGPLKNSLAQVGNPHLFGDYKKSYQREALQYLNTVYQPGDAVYIYWNELPGYKLYQTIQPLKFTGIEGHDYRHKANSFDMYFSKLDADLKAIGKKRIWVVYSNIDIPVGDYIGNPAWYYQNNDGVEQFHKHLQMLGREVEMFRPAGKGVVTNVHVSLVTLP